ncbi:hypothetical protein HanXRQr2_Chr15g0707861 [Helianthus annuus]|uniref:Uncharacterized protein n=1 Tax=Helianthus annuus TaxID=4232 RepID=A0A251SA53_HELAN|nr:hypothetical protein HanXRQr2_Chr15g0707861 [Helianthus annuus]KAJ0452276.1 hypothetical protein HanHA300_Chr15g0577091 [Helianthus annuus]KAJ0474173.1 hypothetical protein HanHA89_Chr15g0626711 [Helianthus annuus]
MKLLKQKLKHKHTHQCVCRPQVEKKKRKNPHKLKSVKYEGRSRLILCMNPNL